MERKDQAQVGQDRDGILFKRRRMPWDCLRGSIRNERARNMDLVGLIEMNEKSVQRKSKK